MDILLTNNIDVKAELELDMTAVDNKGNEPEERVQKKSENPVGDGDQSKGRRIKGIKEREERRARKDAEIAAVDQMAMDILKFQPCASCSELRQRLDEKNSLNDDLKASIEAKKAVIASREDEIKKLELKATVERSSHGKSYSIPYCCYSLYPI